MGTLNTKLLVYTLKSMYPQLQPFSEQQVLSGTGYVEEGKVRITNTKEVINYPALLERQRTRGLFYEAYEIVVNPITLGQTLWKLLEATYKFTRPYDEHGTYVNIYGSLQISNWTCGLAEVGRLTSCDSGTARTRIADALIMAVYNKRGKILFHDYVGAEHACIPILAEYGFTKEGSPFFNPNSQRHVQPWSVLNNGKF